MTEQWKPIVETDGLYEVSNLGRVRNKNTGVIRKQKQLPNGYLHVHYQISGKRADRYVHRLVAEAFCEHYEGCDVINHIDNNPKNNNAENLEWTTQRENVYHGMKQGRYRLNAMPVIAIKNGITYKFSSANQAAKVLSCDNSSITKCCKGKRKLYYGFEFRYAEVMV